MYYVLELYYFSSTSTYVLPDCHDADLTAYWPSRQQCLAYMMFQNYKYGSLISHKQGPGDVDVVIWCTVQPVTFRKMRA